MVQAIRALWPTGQTPLIGGPARWATMDDRQLAAMLSDAAVARGEDIRQIEADALHQAKGTGLFGVPSWLLDKISRACSFDLESRPHTLKAGEGPVGTPPQHAKLARRLERLCQLTVMLTRAAEAELRSFKAGEKGHGILSRWISRAKTTERRLKRSLRVFKEEYERLGRGGKVECLCSVCVRIRHSMKRAASKLRDADAVFEEIFIAIDEAKYTADFLAVPRPAPPPTRPAAREVPTQASPNAPTSVPRAPLSDPAPRPPPATRAGSATRPMPARMGGAGLHYDLALLRTRLGSIRIRLQTCSRLSDEFGQLKREEGYYEAFLEMMEKDNQEGQEQGRHANI